MSAPMKHWKVPIALYLFFVFLSGSVVGALAYRIYSPPTARGVGSRPRRGTEEFHRQYMEEMRTRLNLSSDQLQKLDGILSRTDERFNDARSQHNQMIRQLREDHVASVRELLTAEQLPKYEQLRTEREQRAKQFKASQGR
jgi:hypothetical protein